MRMRQPYSPPPMPRALFSRRGCTGRSITARSQKLARTDEVFLGIIALNAEVTEIPSYNLTYWVTPDAEGHGYVSEAVQLIVSCAFDRLGSRRVGLYCDPRNARSARVADRLAFVLEGRVRNDSLTPDGLVRDTLVYSMIPEDYERVRDRWR
jgi:RimJ/RimL family protein N-acetyltransferase